MIVLNIHTGEQRNTKFKDTGEQRNIHRRTSKPSKQNSISRFTRQNWHISGLYLLI